MAKINLTLEHEIVNGETVTFEAPCDCSAVDGLRVTYPTESGEETKEFCFRDAHNNDLADLGNLFAEGAVVKVILRTTTGCAYIQNADTNGYLESILSEMSSVRIVTRTGQGGTGVCSLPITKKTIAVIALRATPSNKDAFGRWGAMVSDGAFCGDNYARYHNFLMLPKVMREIGAVNLNTAWAGFYSNASSGTFGWADENFIYWQSSTSNAYYYFDSANAVYNFLVIDG